MKKLLFLMFFVTQIAALAQNEQDKVLSDSLKSGGWEPNYFAMLFGLFLVIGLVYLTAFAYQKLLKVKFDSEITEKNFPKIVSTTPLGQNKNLHIVKINDEYILIGSTQNTITYIKDIENFEN